MALYANSSEADISASIGEFLTKAGIYNDRLNAGNIRIGDRRVKLCRKGTPDRLVIYRGHAVFIEVKKTKKLKPSPEQLNIHEQLQRAGAIVIIAFDLLQFIGDFTDAKKKIDAKLC